MAEKALRAKGYALKALDSHTERTLLAQFFAMPEGEDKESVRAAIRAALLPLFSIDMQTMILGKRCAK